ncbi:MAG TPA: nuclear transport factor 2 family protein [Acidimicrobiales bacterium]|nr:nuclear transport factor 2 family protein [Acidimicrobiales bacterium]
MDLQTLGDRLEINDLLTRYAHSVDSKDWALYRSVFTDGAFIDYESAGGIKGDREEVANWLEKTMAGFPMTQHLISNIDVKIDGDRASVRAMFYNPMGMPSGKTFWCGGFYNHSLVRTAEGWKSERLIEESSWFDRAAEAMGG